MSSCMSACNHQPPTANTRQQTAAASTTSQTHPPCRRPCPAGWLVGRARRLGCRRLLPRPTPLACRALGSHGAGSGRGGGIGVPVSGLKKGTAEAATGGGGVYRGRRGSLKRTLSVPECMHAGGGRGKGGRGKVIGGCSLAVALVLHV